MQVVFGFVVAIVFVFAFIGSFQGNFGCGFGFKPSTSFGPKQHQTQRQRFGPKLGSGCCCCCCLSRLRRRQLLLLLLLARSSCAIFFGLRSAAQANVNFSVRRPVSVDGHKNGTQTRYVKPTTKIINLNTSKQKKKKTH